MRLTHLKLAGFKSFVDATTIAIPGQLVAVVGPNGCGKSNLIDAVRWVLGASSAKQLRGVSMQDVIFNGANTRQPVSRASVELVFDNSDNAAQGSWGSYTEIAIKRVLTRSGDSFYYINNQIVRRKDINDLFLGTGVGVGGYAVIEQGMVARIIEARPEELRAYLEEAAGISKYKERRKETETHLRETAQNTARLGDIQLTLTQRMATLSEQANLAGDYQRLKKTLIHQQTIFALFKKEQAKETLAEAQGALAQIETELVAAETNRWALESELSALKVAQQGLAANSLSHQQRVTLAHTELVKAEMANDYQHKEARQLAANLAACEHQKTELAAESTQVQARLTVLLDAKTEAELALTEAQLTLDTTEEVLPDLELALKTATQTLAARQQHFQAHRQTTALCQQKLEHAQQQQRVHQQQRERLVQTQRTWAESLPDATQRLAATQHAWACESAYLNAQSQYQALERALAKAESQQEIDLAEVAAAQKTEHHINNQRHINQAFLVAAESLSVPSDPAQAKNGDAQNARCGQPLWQQLRVEAPWAAAANAILGANIQARLYTPTPEASAEQVAAAVKALPPNVPYLYKKRNNTTRPFPANSLLSKLHAPADFADFLADQMQGVFVAETVEAAWAQKDQLKAGECVITPQQVWVSRTSFGLSQLPEAAQILEQSAKQALILEQQTHAETSLRQAEAKLAATKNHLYALRANLASQKSELLKLEQAHQLAQKTHWQLQSVQQQADTRQQEFASDMANLEATLLADEDSILTLEWQLSSLLESEIDNDLPVAEAAVGQAQQALNLAQQAAHAAEKTCTQAQHTLQTLEQDLKYTTHAVTQNQQKTTALHEQLAQLSAAQKRLAASAQTEAIDALRLAWEKAKADWTASLNAEEQGQQNSQQTQENYHALLLAVPKLNDKKTQQLLRIQEATLEAQAQQMALEQLGLDAANLSAYLPEALSLANPNATAAHISRLARQLDDFGAVNLAAALELEETQKQALYYEEQQHDLAAATQMLTDAIKKIDAETRTLLQSTFAAVNAKMGEIFPTLFGGGSAQLVLTDDDLLNAGMQLIAHPPGKKNSSIHLLSGGEKALTALSLVFALFALNPAPFCLLDEVDAPLDDANTARFCELVKQLSAHTQFLYISHNRLTMEMAEQLIGVTMQEQGVSRIVSVDMQAAVNTPPHS
jgi:chromosome segregation protein